jgi:hypothetical protein
MHYGRKTTNHRSQQGFYMGQSVMLVPNNTKTGAYFEFYFSKKLTN